MLRTQTCEQIQKPTTSPQFSHTRPIPSFTFSFCFLSSPASVPLPPQGHPHFPVFELSVPTTRALRVASDDHFDPDTSPFTQNFHPEPESLPGIVDHMQAQLSCHCMYFACMFCLPAPPRGFRLLFRRIPQPLTQPISFCTATSSTTAAVLDSHPCSDNDNDNDHSYSQLPATKRRLAPRARTLGLWRLSVPLCLQISLHLCWEGAAFHSE